MIDERRSTGFGPQHRHQRLRPRHRRQPGVHQLRQQAPGAKIAVVTVFPSIHRGAAARTTDAAIIGAARSVDPSVVVISPLSEGWTYRSAEDGHPGSAAHERIAERVSGLV